MTAARLGEAMTAATSAKRSLLPIGGFLGAFLHGLVLGVLAAQRGGDEVTRGWS